MQSMIITIKNSENTFQYDIEAPTDLKGLKFTEDLIEGLRQLNSSLAYSPLYHGVFIDRLQKFLNDDQTLAEAGIRNGDYCTLVIKQR